MMEIALILNLSLTMAKTTFLDLDLNESLCSGDENNDYATMIVDIMR